MSKVNLSKSSYCKCVQCEKILWLNQYKKDIAIAEDKESVFETGKKVGEYAKRLFGNYVDIPLDKTLNERIKKTDELLNDKANVITEASFIYENNFCSVDILKNDNDGVEIYEVKSSTKIKDIYLDDASYQYFVLSNLGLNVKKVAIVYINNEYIRGKQLDINQLFNIEDITDIALEKQSEIKANIEMINNYMAEHGKDNEPIKDIGKFCFDPYSCAFWQYCTKDLPTPNVFDISGMQKRSKFKQYYGGNISFEDLQHTNINIAEIVFIIK